MEHRRVWVLGWIGLAVTLFLLSFAVVVPALADDPTSTPTQTPVPTVLWLRCDHAGGVGCTDISGPSYEVNHDFTDTASNYGQFICHEGNCTAGEAPLYFRSNCSFIMTTGSESIYTFWYSKYMENGDTQIFETDILCQEDVSIAECEGGISGYITATYNLNQSSDFNIHYAMSQFPGGTSGAACDYEWSTEQFTDSCTLNYDLTGVGGNYVVGATAQGGNIHNAVAGSYYSLRATDGIWNDGSFARKDLAVSLDNGVTWKAVSAFTAEDECMTYVGEYQSLYFMAPGDFIRVRVNDGTGLFGNNSGEMYYNLSLANYYPPNEEVESLIQDGNMELDYPDYTWYWIQAGDTRFGRIFPNWWNQFWHGHPDPYCNSGIQLIRPCVPPNCEGAEDDEEIGDTTWQHFYWSGGRAYFRFAVRGKNFVWFLPPSTPYYYTVKVRSEENSDVYVIADNAEANGNDWTHVTGYISYMPAGNYELWLEKGNQAGEKIGIYYDIVDIGHQSLPNVPAECEPEEGTPTPTATGSQTITPSPSITGTLQSTLTPTTAPIRNYVNNCGFEMGSIYWNFKPNSRVIYNGDGPAGPNYGLAARADPAPRIYQTFSWSSPEPAFVTAWVRGKYRIVFKNPNTGGEYLVASNSSGTSAWTFIQSYANLPAGIYQIWLDAAGTSGDVSYDGISVTKREYGQCDPGNETTTATPEYTMAPNPTITSIYATRTAGTPTITETPGPGTPSVTFAPTGTGMGPTSTGTITPGPTWTPGGPTATGTLTLVPGGTGIPWPTNMPPVGGGSGGGTCNASCDRPGSALELAGWFEYGRCEFSSYIAWCPEYNATLEALPTLLDNREPFGSVNSINNARSTVSSLVNERDWSAQNAPTITITPMWILSTPAPPGNPWVGEGVNLEMEWWDFTDWENNTCNMILTESFGSKLAYGMCSVFTVLDRLGITPWFGALINVMALFIGYKYVSNKWIDTKGS